MQFLPVMRFCVKTINQHINWAVAIGICNKNCAHKDLYAALRLEYSTVPTALLQAVRDTAMEAVKASHSLQVPIAQGGGSTKLKRSPRKKSTALRYDARSITITLEVINSHRVALVSAYVAGIAIAPT